MLTAKCSANRPLTYCLIGSLIQTPENRGGLLIDQHGIV